MERSLCKGRDKKLAGVCSGIADYFDWDVTWVRIAAAVLALSYGSGLLIYIIAAIVMPEYTED